MFEIADDAPCLSSFPHGDHAVHLTTVLVLSGGGFQGLALVKALNALPCVRILVADTFRENVTRFSAHGFHVAPPLRDETAFTEFLLNLCADQRVDSVFPSTDHELDLLAKIGSRLEAQGTRVWVSSQELLRVARHKGRFYAWLQANDLPVLPVFSDPLDIDAVGPLIGKPVSGWGGHDIVRVSSGKEAAALPRAQLDRLVWQPLLTDFEEYSIDFSIDHLGRVSPLYLRRRIRTMGGFAVLCEPTNNSIVHDIASRAVGHLCALGGRGVLNLQILVAKGQGWISDLNPRTGTSMPLTLVAGGNPVAFLLGMEPGRVRLEAASRTVRLLTEQVLTRPRLSHVRGVVFDLDDTLFDQKDWIARKLRMVWHAERAWLPAEQEFLARIWCILEEGERARMFDSYVQQTGLGEAQRLRLIEAYREAIPRECRLYPDVVGTLAQLRSQGFKLGLLTDNPPESQRRKIDCAQLSDAFDTMIMTGDIGCRKPASKAFESVSNRLELPEEALVMVGDNLFRDSLGALDAGFAHAFHIQRQGGFYNFDIALCDRVLPEGRWTQLRGLQELDWYLCGDES